MVIPAFVLIGLAYSEIFLYIGLLLFAFGKLLFISLIVFLLITKLYAKFLPLIFLKWHNSCNRTL